MTRSYDRAIDRALQTLDAADADVDPTTLRARADKERILSTDPSGWSAETTRAPVRAVARTTRGLRRAVLAGGVVTAVAVGLVALPSLTGGDLAFASWTSVPDEMTPAQRAEAGASCRQAEMKGAGVSHIAELGAADVAIAERRGSWSTVVLAGDSGFAALCITDDSAGYFTDNMIGSVGTPTGYSAPGPRDVAATDLGSGTMSAGDLSLAAGTVGRAIVKIVYNSRVHGEVVATIANGRFALWFPGDELSDASSTDGVEVEVTYLGGATGTVVLAL